MPDAASTARNDLKPLTSLRFVAALLVFFDHAPITRAFAERYSIGEFGVAFFFLLSGFILMVTYHKDFSERVTWTDLRRFYVARFARIYPMHVATTFLAVAALVAFGESAPGEYGRLWASGAAEDAQKLLGSLLLVQPWSSAPSVALGVNPPAWSIGDEAFFYALFPFAGWYVLRAFRTVRPIVVLSTAAVMWAIAVTTFLHAPIDNWLMSYFPPVRLIDFVVGILLGLAFIKRRPSADPLSTIWEIAAVACIGAALAVIPSIPGQLRFALWMMPFSALLISVFARQAGAISHLLSQRTFVFLGEASFAFYLIHNIALTAATALLGPTLASSVAAFSITVALSCVAFVQYERPMRQWLRGGFRRREPAPA